ncbi:MAG: HNH endonuclease, partial [Actinobacteria bacterium]|nr:HNH endonuclease [Actinomycetota bacterium]
VGHIDSLATAERPEFAVPERELMAHAGMSSREARDAVARSLVTESAPQLADALAKGDTTAAHLDAVRRGLKIAGADRDAFLAHMPHLATAATTMSIGDFNTLVKDTAKAVQSDGGLALFEQQQRQTYIKTWTDHEGMLQVRGQFDPISGAAFTSLVEQQKERMFHSGDREVPVNVAPGIEPNDHRRAHALLALINHTPTADDIARPQRAEVVVHIDLATLTGGPHANTTCRTHLGTDIPAETARRLACEADIIPVVLDGHSVPIDVGRAKRLATIHQRRALEAIHTTCAIPDCDVPYHRCQIHHIDYWENGGRTDMSNQLPLCNKHHHAVHEGGWTLTLDLATRAVTFTR